jgi:hypothetical protein
MSLLLVSHDQDAPGAQLLEDAVWQLAESHLILSGSMIVESAVSGPYLLQHLQGALRRSGRDGTLIVTPISSAEWSGLSPEAEAWIRGRLA